MRESEKAKQLVKAFDGDGLDKNEMIANAIFCVDQIIDALKVTTGHLTLKLLDRHGVKSDFDYWDRVKLEITKLR